MIDAKWTEATLSQSKKIGVALNCLATFLTFFGVE